MLSLGRLWKSAITEADWLKYYEFNRMFKSVEFNEDFSDVNFYDRIIERGSVINSIANRCSVLNLTSDKPVLECKISDLRTTTESRDHSKNIYTALEYFVGRGIGTPQIIKIIKGG